jgi:SAM-dependent methyltransferase
MFKNIVTFINGIEINQEPGVIPIAAETCDFMHHLRHNVEWATCLDLGCGTGVFGVTLAEPGKNVLCTDISDAALALTLRNAEHNKKTVDVLKSNWYESLEGGVWDLIISNPPHAHTLDYEQADDELKAWVPLESIDGGQNGLAGIVAVMEEAADHLSPTGHLALMCDREFLDGLDELAEWAGLRMVNQQISENMAMSIFCKV